MLMLNKSLLLMTAIFLIWCCQAFASGFAIIEQSVSGLGTSFSGGAASANDASTVYFNPAGMMLLEGQQATAGVHYIMPSAKFSGDDNEPNNLQNVDGASLGTNDGGEGAVDKIVPNFYYTNRISESLAFGLGINAPFGLATEYDKDWVGRYHAVESDVTTVNINPAIAFKATEKLSFGIGFNAQYMEATLSSMVDASGAAVSAYDVFVENNADDWGYGYNLGLIYEFTENNRIGISYRSEVKHKLEGDVKSSIPEALLALNPAISGYFQTQDINGSITLPAMASLSYFHQATNKLAIMADISWTQWSSFDELTINFEGTGIGGSSSTTTTESWDDTWRYSIGATYQATKDLLLRIGTAYDQTPIPDEYRTPRIPGEDRIWLSLGAGYNICDRLTIDAAYTHLFVDDSKMEKSASVEEDMARGTVIGTFENAVDIVSLQLTYNF